MSQTMIDLNLARIEQGRLYTIMGFREGHEDYANYLRRMGFITGTVVKLGPSDIKDPFTLSIRGGRIALRKKEASCIMVKEISGV